MTDLTCREGQTQASRVQRPGPAGASSIPSTGTAQRLKPGTVLPPNYRLDLLLQNHINTSLMVRKEMQQSLKSPTLLHNLRGENSR